MKKILLTALLSFTASFLFSQIVLDTVRYKVGDTECIGLIAKPAKITKKTKSILIVHEWWGLNDYPQMRAKQLAAEGFIAFCVDMYGNQAVGTTPDEAKALAGPIYQSPQLSYDRFMGAYNALIAQKGVNPSLVAAIGYCFGGSVVLNAAKMGAPVDAVVSFHGGLGGVPVSKAKMTAAVLVCNGAADSFVPQADIDALQQDMIGNGEDYTFINYADATHAFTNPKSTENGKKFNMPISYNEAADKKSYADFLAFVKKKVK